jgi:HEAT repeat protein
MKTSKLNFALVAILVGVACNAALAQQPTPLLTQSADQCVAVLKSGASQKEKADACRQLAVIGTKDAVPALAALLPDEKLNHMARYALETIPDAAADQALREALAKLQGRPLVGVIGSLGVRKDTQAVPALVKLLSDSDPDVAQGAARALGKIANPAAVDALKQAVGTVSAANRLAFCEGLLRCAEALNDRDERRQAIAIYDQLRGLDGPQQVRVAAVRGAILTRLDRGGDLVREGLRSKDFLVFSATVRAAYEAPMPPITRALVSELPLLPDDDHKILVIQVLSKRPGTLPALSAAAKTGSKPARVAAVRALAESGDPAAAPALVDLLGDSEREISRAALDSLAGLQGKQVDETVQGMLRSQNTQRRLAGIELIGRRRMSACLPDLLKAGTDTDAQVRPAALSKVGELGGPADLTPVLDLLPKLSARQDLDAAEQALSTICSKAERPEACTDKLTARLYQAQPGQKSALLRVLSSVGGAGALQAVRAAVNDPNPEVHGAAIRALGAWKTADAAPDLLVLAKTSANPTDQTLCLRSYLGLAANPDVPAAQRLAMCHEAASLAKGNEEKKLLLAALGSIDSTDSVAMIMPYLDDSGTKEEASAAVAGIAEKMLKGQRSADTASKLIQPLEKVGQATTNEELAKRVKGLLQQAQRRSGNR